MRRLWMDECFLRAEGREFDVDRFLVGTSFAPEFVWRRGENQSIKSVRLREDSGFSLVVAQVSTTDEKSLIEATVRFIRENFAQLELLRDAPGIEKISLDIAVEREVQRVPGSADPLSALDDMDMVTFEVVPELAQLLAALRARITFSVCSPGRIIARRWSSSGSASAPRNPA
jgi:hypothetical protein